MKKLLSVLFAISALSLFTGFSAEKDYYFKYFLTGNDLSVHYINDIFQDSRGFIWLSTRTGFCRYDGKDFIQYSMLEGDKSGVTGDNITSICEDAAGYLWLETNDGSRSRFDVKNETFVRIPDDVIPDIAGKKIDAFLTACDGTIWFACTDAGLFSLTPDLQLTSHPELEAKYIKRLFQDKDGNIFIVSDDGLSIMQDGEEVRISRGNVYGQMMEYAGYSFFLSRKDILGFKSTSNERVHIEASEFGRGDFTSLTVSGGSLYIGMTDGAIASVNESDFNCQVHTCEMGKVIKLFPDPEGLLWIETDRPGIVSWNPATKAFKHYGDEGTGTNSVWSCSQIVHGKHGTWLMMRNSVIGWYDREVDKVVTLQDDTKVFKSDNIQSFTEDKSGHLWILDRSNGVVCVSPTERIVDIIAPADGAIYCNAFCDSKGRLWIASESNGVFVYDRSMTIIKHFPGQDSPDIGKVCCLSEDDNGNIWLGTNSGLFKVSENSGKWKFTHYLHDSGNKKSLPSNNVRAIGQDNEGRIWIGSDGDGISVMPDPDNDEFHSCKDLFPDYPLSNFSHISSILCSRQDTIYIGTSDGLLWFKAQKNLESTKFQTARHIAGDDNSLGNDDVVSIFEDLESNVWICTFGGGLNRLEFKDGQPYFNRVNTLKGLSSNVVLSAIEDEDNDIWISTDKGLSCYLQKLDKVENFNYLDGIPTATYRENAVTHTSDSCIVFCASNKNVKLNPQTVQKAQKESLNLSVVQFYVDGKRIPVTDNLTVKKGYYHFRIVCSSMSFRTDEGRDLMYRLKGYENEWISLSGANGVTYSRVKPGKYQFQICVSSDESSTVSVPVTIEATFLQSELFKIIAVLVSVAVLLYLMILKYKSEKLKNSIDNEKYLDGVKTRFFTNVSHELRTPLTIIIGGIEELKKHVPHNEKTDFSISVVMKNAKRLLSLINQLLDIKQISSGSLRLVISRTDIVKLLSDVFNDFKDTAKERNVEYHFTRSTDSLFMWADATRIEALIYNLLSNAFKYTPDGGSINLILHEQDSPSSITIEVRDNGAGIPREYHARIFKDYFRTGRNSENGVEGNGVGLAFCKEIVDFHSGSIWVESKEDEGSQFFVTLPINRGHFNPDSVVFAEEETSNEEIETGVARFRAELTCPAGAAKVLFVEDDSELRLFMYNNLASTYNIKDAFNGEDAIGILEHGWIPDIIVTDMMMPVMDGMEFIRRVRAMKNTANTPIIVLTAKDGEEANKEATALGVENYLVKPVTPDLLTAKIDNVLSKKKKLDKIIADKKLALLSEGVEITDRDSEMLQKIALWLEDNYKVVDVTIDMMAQGVGMGRTTLYNKMKALTGKSPIELLMDYRTSKAKAYLKSGQCSVAETAYKVGFTDPGYFSRTFKKYAGITPAKFIKDNKVTD